MMNSDLTEEKIIVHECDECGRFSLLFIGHDEDRKSCREVRDKVISALEIKKKIDEIPLQDVYNALANDQTMTSFSKFSVLSKINELQELTKYVE